MRTDYALYIAALICFFIGAYAAVSVEVQLYVYTLAVVGIVFVGLGYMARPKTTVVAASTPAPSPPKALPKVEPAPKAETEEEKKEPVKKTTRRTRRRKKPS
ncbi:MAG TPA: hypothetical protein VMW14_03250 [Candidatus Paceibacterota bacterium]|nr:hypothetical protein [Candidatus Paceibacterota bacterium]